MKENIKFICYRYVYHTDNGNSVTTLFSFYPNGVWDEDKLTIDEAVVQYPPDKYNWIHSDN